MARIQGWVRSGRAWSAPARCALVWSGWARIRGAARQGTAWFGRVRFGPVRTQGAVRQRRGEGLLIVAGEPPRQPTASDQFDLYELKHGARATSLDGAQIKELERGYAESR